MVWNQLMGEARVQFMKLICQRVQRIIGMIPMDDVWDFDTWVPRTNSGAYAYVKTLGELRPSRWWDICGVRQEALCVQQPLLRAESRYLR